MTKPTVSSGVWHTARDSSEQFLSLVIRKTLEYSHPRLRQFFTDAIHYPHRLFANTLYCPPMSKLDASLSLLIFCLHVLSCPSKHWLSLQQTHSRLVSLSESSQVVQLVSLSEQWAYDLHDRSLFCFNLCECVCVCVCVLWRHADTWHSTSSQVHFLLLKDLYEEYFNFKL